SPRLRGEGRGEGRAAGATARACGAPPSSGAARYLLPVHGEKGRARWSCGLAPISFLGLLLSLVAYAQDGFAAATATPNPITLGESTTLAWTHKGSNPWCYIHVNGVQYQYYANSVSYPVTPPAVGEHLYEVLCGSAIESVTVV